MVTGKWLKEEGLDQPILVRYEYFPIFHLCCVQALTRNARDKQCLGLEVPDPTVCDSYLHTSLQFTPLRRTYHNVSPTDIQGT